MPGFDWHSPAENTNHVIFPKILSSCWLSCGRLDTDTCGNLPSFHKLTIAGPVWNSCNLEPFSHFDKTPHRLMASCGHK